MRELIRRRSVVHPTYVSRKLSVTPPNARGEALSTDQSQNVLYLIAGVLVVVSKPPVRIDDEDCEAALSKLIKSNAALIAAVDFPTHARRKASFAGAFFEHVNCSPGRVHG